MGPIFYSIQFQNLYLFILRVYISYFQGFTLVQFGEVYISAIFRVYIRALEKVQFSWTNLIFLSRIKINEWGLAAHLLHTLRHQREREGGGREESRTEEISLGCIVRGGRCDCDTVERDERGQGLDRMQRIDRGWNHVLKLWGTWTAK
jgi:hypothetical protein